jgi:hypothetical protein
MRARGALPKHMTNDERETGMDYKQAVETIRWHSLHSKMNGAQARVFMNLVAEANYKTGRVRTSYADLAQRISLSKVGVKSAIDALVKKQALCVIEAATGRSPATYRIRTADELTEYFSQEVINPEATKWENARIENGYEKLEDDFYAIVEGCEECTDDEPCPPHQYHMQRFKQEAPWREYQLWLKDNPKPDYKISMVVVPEK